MFNFGGPMISEVSDFKKGNFKLRNLFWISIQKYFVHS